MAALLPQNVFLAHQQRHYRAAATGKTDPICIGLLRIVDQSCQAERNPLNVIHVDGKRVPDATLPFPFSGNVSRAPSAADIFLAVHQQTDSAAQWVDVQIDPGGDLACSSDYGFS